MQIAKNIYGNVVHYLTGERPDPGNAFGTVNLRVPDSKNWSPFQVARFSGPTTTNQQLDRAEIDPKKKNGLHAINRADQIALVHDRLYRQAQSDKDVRQADNLFIRQNIQAMHNDWSIHNPMQFLKNTILHPLDATERFAQHVVDTSNEAAATVAMTAKEIGEDYLGLPVFGKNKHLTPNQYRKYHRQAVHDAMYLQRQLNSEK